MEWIRDILRPFYSLIIIASCLCFVMSVLFIEFPHCKELFFIILDNGELKMEGLDYIKDTQYEEPVPHYIAGAQKMGTSIHFKDMFSMNNAENYAMYLMDIRGASGNSVLEKMTTDEMVNLQEIPAAFIYDTNEDILYFHGSGVYTVYVKVYDKNGIQTIFEFKLPVERG